MNQRILILVFLAVIFPVLSVIGQPPPPPPQEIPIDGGLLFLLAAGIAFAGRKLFRRNKKQDNY